MDVIEANAALKVARARIKELESTLAIEQSRLSAALTRIALLERVNALVRRRY